MGRLKPLQAYREFFVQHRNRWLYRPENSNLASKKEARQLICRCPLKIVLVYLTLCFLKTCLPSHVHECTGPNLPKRLPTLIFRSNALKLPGMHENASHLSLVRTNLNVGAYACRVWLNLNFSDFIIVWVVSWYACKSKILSFGLYMPSKYINTLKY